MQRLTLPDRPIRGHVSGRSPRLRLLGRLSGAAALVAGLLSLSAPVVAQGAPAFAAPTLTSLGKRGEPEATGYRLRIDSGQPPASAALDLSRFSFTAPGEAPRVARGNSVERSFRFTPSGDRKAVSVAVSTRLPATGAEGASPAVRSALSVVPAAGPALPDYAMGMAVGWKGFALTTNMARSETALGFGNIEEVDVGLSYGGRRWRTGVVAGAERGSLLAPQPTLDSNRYSLGAMGSFALSPAVSLSGGIRYRPAPPNPSLLEPNRQEEAVYIGGALAF